MGPTSKKKKKFEIELKRGKGVQKEQTFAWRHLWMTFTWKKKKKKKKLDKQQLLLKVLLRAHFYLSFSSRNKSFYLC